MEVKGLTAPFVCVRGRVILGPQALEQLATEFQHRLRLASGDGSSSEHPGSGGGGGGGERWLLSGEVAGAMAARLGPAPRCACPSLSSSTALSVEEIALHADMAAGDMGEDPSHHFWRCRASPTDISDSTGSGGGGAWYGCADGREGAGDGGKGGGEGGGQWWRRGARVEEARVRSITNLTDNVRWPDVRDVRHVVLQADSQLEYNAGDVALVYPRNRPAVTNALLSILRLDGDAHIDAFRCPDLADVVLETLNIQAPCTLRELISAQPDLQRPPRRSTLRALSLLAEDADDRERLLDIADNPSEFREYIEACRRPVIGVLQDFATLRKADLGALLSVLPRLQPRAYSIASSPRRHRGEFHLCVALARVTSPVLAAGWATRGVCSSFIASLSPGRVVPIEVMNHAQVHS